jgi:hypothetical protein
MKMRLHLLLESDATFGRGDGVAGLVDEEVEHDEYGLPYLRGRTLKGLLVEECANILFTLKQARLSETKQHELEEAAQYLFGRAGSTLSDDALAQFGAARLPKDLRDALIADVEAYEQLKGGLSPTEVLESLTSIRRQTAVDAQTDAPEKGSLRSMRVLLRGISLIADVDLNDNELKPEQQTMALALLAACALGLRRAGTGRNRGRGRLAASLCNEGNQDVTGEHFQRFRAFVNDREVER